jgi:quercetin dioxygenase-like cupin family protein
MPRAAVAVPFVLAPDGGEALRNPTAGHMTLKVRAADSGGSLTALEATAAPGLGPPLHLHPDQDELIYVLDGAFRVRVGADVRPAPPGTTVWIPRGTEHTWQVAGEASGRFFATFSPAAPEFEALFRRVDALGEAERRPEALAGLAAETGGLVVVGPPL